MSTTVFLFYFIFFTYKYCHEQFYFKNFFSGDFCETSLKPMAKSLYQNSISHIQPKQACFHNMCLNGGTCSQLTNSIAVCFCLLDYSGNFNCKKKNKAKKFELF